MPQFIVPITVEIRSYNRFSCSHSLESFLLRLILPGNGGKVGSAYHTGFYQWSSSITTVIFERIPIVIDNGPPLTIKALRFSSGLAKNIYRAPIRCHTQDLTMKMIRQDAQTGLPPLQSREYFRYLIIFIRENSIYYNKNTRSSLMSLTLHLRTIYIN